MDKRFFFPLEREERFSNDGGGAASDRFRRFLSVSRRVEFWSNRLRLPYHTLDQRVLFLSSDRNRQCIECAHMRNPYLINASPSSFASCYRTCSHFFHRSHHMPPGLAALPPQFGGILFLRTHRHRYVSCKCSHFHRSLPLIAQPLTSLPDDET